jgi:hypothetical protein
LDISTWKQSQPQSKQQEAKGQKGKPQTANHKPQPFASICPFPEKYI